MLVLRCQLARAGRSVRLRLVFEAGEKGLGRVLASRSSSSPRIVAITRVTVRVAVAGSVLHAVGDQGVPIREVAETFAAHLGVPAVSVTPGQAGEYVGFPGGFWGFDGPLRRRSRATCSDGSRPARG